MPAGAYHRLFFGRTHFLPVPGPFSGERREANAISVTYNTEEMGYSRGLLATDEEEEEEEEEALWDRALYRDRTSFGRPSAPRSARPPRSVH